MENLTILHDAQLHVRRTSFKVYDLGSLDLLQPIVNPGSVRPDFVILSFNPDIVM